MLAHQKNSRRPARPARLAALVLLALTTGALAQESVVLAPINVLGYGETRQVQVLPRSDLEQAAPGTSPIKALGKLAGVNVQSADAFGAYEWAIRISVRGFNQTQMGFTLDDVPLGDMFYSSLNGLTISRALLGENLDRARLSQGTGALETASTSNLGGAIQFYSVDPGNTPGLSVAQTLGSKADNRTFLKYESGRLADASKFYLSYAQQSQDLWKGSGRQSYDQFNGKYVRPIAAAAGSGLLSAYFNYSDRREIDYQDMTKAWINQLGYRWTNYWPNLNAAIANAGATGDCCGVPVQGRQTVNDPLDAAYYFASGVRRDYLGQVSLALPLDADSDFKATVYGHSYHGASTWATPYKATPGPDGAPISERVLAYQTRRFGALVDFNREFGRHTVNSGLWYEHNVATQTRYFFPITLSGPLWTPYQFPDPSTAFLTQWSYDFHTNTVQYHLQDTYRASERLSLHGGFKSLYSNTLGTPTVNHTSTPDIAHGEMSAIGNFLPQIGANWKIGAQDELFANVAKTLRTFPQGGYGLGISPWAVGNQAAFQLIRGSLKPESAVTYEAGYRFHRAYNDSRVRSLEALLTAYHVKFSNRLLNISPGGSLIAATSGAAILANVGGVTTNGIEASGKLELFRHLVWHNSLSLNRSTYDSDYNDGNTVVATAGKTVVDTPRVLFKTELAYQRDGRFVRLGGDYLSTRYFTYTNDQSVAPRWLFNLGVGQSFGRIGALSELTLQADVYNLFDKQYVSTLGTGGFTASGDNQTLQVGAPRQLFITLKAHL